MKRFISFILIFLMLNSICFADNWITEHIDSITSSSGMTFENQKRGVFAGPSLSMRSNGLSKMQPFSLSLPNINVGCGGIDVFLGSFGYLQPEYLIEKFKKMLGAAAPAVAYSLAMSVVGDEIKNTYENITAIIDRLNQLNVDSCAAVKQVQAVIEDKKPLAQAATDFLATTGWAETRQAIEKTSREWKTAETFQKKTGKDGSNASKMAKGCPAMIKVIENMNKGKYFFKDVVFESFFKDLSTTEKQFTLAIIGDFYLAKHGRFDPVKPCNDVEKINFESLLNNKLEVADGYEEKSGKKVMKCKKADNINGQKSFLAYVKKEINLLGNCIALNDYSSLTNEDKSFLAKLPFGLVSLFRYELSGLSYDEKQVKIKSISSIYGPYLASLYLSFIFNEYSRLMNSLVKDISIAIDFESEDSADDCVSVNSTDALKNLKAYSIPVVNRLSRVLAEEMPVIQQSLINTLAVESNIERKKARFEDKIKLLMKNNRR